MQVGYEKQIALPSSEEKEDLESLVIDPKQLPLMESLLCSSNSRHFGDAGLFMSRQFRVGWAPFWYLANPWDSLEKMRPSKVSPKTSILLRF